MNGPELYMVFDGPPGPDGPRFVELEDAYGVSHNSKPAEWTDRGDGYWTLGPFKPVDATEGVTAGRVVSIRGNPQRITTALVNDAIGDIQRGGERLASKYFGLKDYDRFSGQREDHDYFMGPRHGHIVVAVEMERDVRDQLDAGIPLTAEQKAEATAFLSKFPETAP
jgi:hypothetical protein